MKIYPEYQVINSLWLKKIPKHWNYLRVSSIFHERKEKNSDYIYKSAYKFKFGTLVLKDEFGTLEELQETYEKYTVISKNNIVVNGLNLNYDFLTQRVAIAQDNGIITSAYMSMSVRKNNNHYYLNYLLKAMDGMKMLNGMGTGIRLTLGFNEFKKYYLPIPPKPEQDQIVKFLDHKITQIDKFINGKKREIELLKELKQAEINRVVTKGLNPDVEMQDSGIDWLGEIPKHWDVLYLRNLLSITSTKNRPELPLLSVVREKGIIMRDVTSKEENHNFIPDDLSGCKLVNKGQFVINKMKAWQGSYGVSKYTGIVSPAYYTFDLNFPNKEFFHTAIRSKIYVNFFAQYSDGIRVGQWDLSKEKMKMIPFFVPPASEQDDIINYITKLVNSIKEYSREMQNEIKYAREYKTSLISEVVTGRVDVRNLKINAKKLTTTN